MDVWVAADALTARFTGGNWVLGEEACAHLLIGGDRVVGSRQAAIPGPSGGALIDTEARAALMAMLAAWTDRELTGSGGKAAKSVAPTPQLASFVSLARKLSIG